MNFVSHANLTFCRPHLNYTSLDRRDDRERPPEGRYRRSGATSSRPEYEYRRLPTEKDYLDDRYRRRQQPIIDRDPRDRDRDPRDRDLRDRDPRDHRDDYDDVEGGGYRERDRRDRSDRYDREHRRYPEDRRRPEDQRYPPQPGREASYDPYREKYRERPRADEPYRDDRATYDYPPRTYDQPSTSTHPSGPMGGQNQNQMGQQNQMNPMGQMSQLNHQMSQMQLGGSSIQQGGPIGIPSSSGIGGMGGGGMGMPGGDYPNGGMQKSKQMTAKFDYDSRQLSPNVDAEQVSWKG